MKELVLKPTADGGLSEIYLPFEIQRLLSRALMRQRAVHYTIDLMSAEILRDPGLPFHQKRMEPWVKRLEADGYVSDDSTETSKNCTVILSPYDPEALYAYARQFFGKNMDPEYARYREWHQTNADASFDGSFPQFFFETLDLEDLESALVQEGYPASSIPLIPLEEQICTEPGYRLHFDNVLYRIAQYFGRIDEYDEQPFYDQAQNFFGLHALFETKPFDNSVYDDFIFDELESDEDE